MCNEICSLHVCTNAHRTRPVRAVGVWVFALNLIAWGLLVFHLYNDHEAQKTKGGVVDFWANVRLIVVATLTFIVTLLLATLLSIENKHKVEVPPKVRPKLYLKLREFGVAAIDCISCTQDSVISWFLFFSFGVE